MSGDPIREAPATISLNFCPECGKNDHVSGPFRGKSHWWLGVHCKGKPVEVEYALVGEAAAKNKRISELSVLAFERGEEAAALRDKAFRLEQELGHLRDEVEMDACDRAVAAGMGASEWDAFLSPRLRKALAGVVPAQPAEEQR